VSKQTKTSSPKNPPAARAADSGEAKLQLENFNRGMELFHARDFRRARDFFEKAAGGPNREMVFAARTHQRMCEQRLEKAAPVLETPDDYYNYGVALTNERRLEEARKHLEKAAALRTADHYEYALALCLGLAGEIDAAAERLRRAIELDPRNRVAVRNDSDFSELLHHAAFQSVLEPNAA
jgi:tetratricopeptide (TPR) repeat protein